MQVKLDQHTQEVINDFSKLGDEGIAIANTIKLASEVSYLKGYSDCMDQEIKNRQMAAFENKIDINLAYEGSN